MPGTSADLLNQLDQATGNVSSVVGNMPDDISSGDEKQQYIEDARRRAGFTDRALDVFDEYLDQTEEMQDEMNTIPGADAAMMAAATNVFSLVKSAQMAPPMADPMMDAPPPPVETPPVGDEVSIEDASGQSFADTAELKEFIDSQLEGEDVDTTRTIDNIIAHFTSVVSDDSEQHVNDALKRYVQFRSSPGVTPQDEINMLEPVFEALPNTMKTPEYSVGDGAVPGTPRVAKIIQDTNRAIQKAAQNHVRSTKTASSFNLKKYAQHKGFDNAFMYGPAEKTVDLFTKMPISDWHLVERNKGFGLQIDDVWDIDYEAIWRGTVMDKYSRPYKDENGNWVGGYIEKRFETDKYIPEGNNYQLKPGQLRRPRLPEHGLTEARMEAMRAEGDRGYEPESSGNPTNWNENGYAKIASKGFNLKSASKKKVK